MKRHYVDRSARADVNYIRYEFELNNADRIYWILARLKLVDPGTEPDSPLAEALQLLRFLGNISIEFSQL